MRKVAVQQLTAPHYTCNAYAGKLWAQRISIVDITPRANNRYSTILELVNSLNLESNG